MNEENINRLKEDLWRMGFGEKLHSKLEHFTNQRFPEFVLASETTLNRLTLQSTLHFTRVAGTDRYVLASHFAHLKNDVGIREQVFYLDRGYQLTLKEVSNLLEGRAVYKEIQPDALKGYQAWLQLDLRAKDMSGNYLVSELKDQSYQLSRELARFPIAELKEPASSERLISSLQKGNLQLVTMELEGRNQKMCIQADPQHKSFRLYDYGALRLLSDQQVASIALVQARKKLNGKEVPIKGEQQGRELKTNNEPIKQTGEQKKQTPSLRNSAGKRKIHGLR